jgi:hypothetical protein
MFTSFKDFLLLSEAPQQGFQYEKNAAAVLKPLGVVPPNFKPAGAGSKVPDLMLVKNGVQSGCELKITAASAGSLVMKYGNGQWSIGNEGEVDDEKLFIIDLAKEVGLLDLIAQKWKNEPYKFTRDSKLKDEIKDLDKKGVYEAELKRFPEIKGRIPTEKIEQYYNKKKTYYVNVGTHGFYLMGPSNPLDVKGVPTFGESANANYRARVQYKGGGTYQFTFEMSFTMSKKSPYNLAPIASNTDVTVPSEVDVSWFLK